MDDFRSYLLALIKEKTGPEREEIMQMYDICEDAHIIVEGLFDSLPVEGIPFDVYEFARKSEEVSRGLSDYISEVWPENLPESAEIKLMQKLHSLEKQAKNGLFVCSSPSCSNISIKNSHTLQRKILQYIEQEGALYKLNIKALYAMRLTKDNEFTKCSSGSLTTFPGFCDNCEKEIFKDIENSPKVDKIKNINKNWLLNLSWRSLCQSMFFSCLKLIEVIKEYKFNLKAYDVRCISSRLKMELFHLLSCLHERVKLEAFLFHGVSTNTLQYRSVLIENNTGITSADYFEFEFNGHVQYSFHQRRHGIIFNECIINENRYLLLTGNFRSAKVKKSFTALTTGRVNPNYTIVNSIIRKSYDFFIREDVVNLIKEDEEIRTSFFVSAILSDVPEKEFTIGTPEFVSISNYGKVHLL